MPEEHCPGRSPCLLLACASTRIASIGTKSSDSHDQNTLDSFSLADDALLLAPNICGLLRSDDCGVRAIDLSLGRGMWVSSATQRDRLAIGWSPGSAALVDRWLGVATPYTWGDQWEISLIVREVGGRRIHSSPVENFLEGALYQSMSSGTVCAVWYTETTSSTQVNDFFLLAKTRTTVIVNAVRVISTRSDSYHQDMH